MDLTHGRPAEDLAPCARRHAKAVLDVAAHVRKGKRRQAPTHADPLPQLAECVRVQLRVQLGLAEQDDLDQLRSRGLEIRDQPHLLECLAREVLRLVDDQHHAPRLTASRQEELVELSQQRSAALAPAGQAELLVDGLKELAGVLARIEEEGHLGLATEALEECSAERRLARAHLTRDDDEALPLLQTIEKVGHRLAM